jgi:predicted RNA-binding protein YlxR (DUF448 family)
MPNRNSHAGNQPQRTCVVCKKTQEQSSLLSFFILPEGVVFDPKRQIQTRKFYLCQGNECLPGLDEWYKRYQKKKLGIKRTTALFSNIKTGERSQ